MIRPHPRAAALMLGLTMLSGCARWNTAYRSDVLPANRPSVVTVDAKQRHVLMVPDTKTTTTTSPDGKITTTVEQRGMRMCAEAAPDVFSALAASGNLDIGVDAKSAAQVNVGAAIAATETAAAIRRTQTVNVIRESFFRTCERYLSGAIGPTAFGVQAARDYRQAIAMLAIEQLTGVVQGPSTIISPGATNTAQTDTAAYYKELKEASSTLAGAKSAHDAAKDAASPDKAPCKAKDGETADEKKTREGLCTAAKTAETDAKTKRDGAQTHLDQLTALGKSGAGQGGITAGASEGTMVNDGGTQTAPSGISAVTLAVTHIADTAMNTDETLMFCLQALSGDDARLSAKTGRMAADNTVSVDDTCKNYLAVKIDAEAAVLKRKAAMRVAAYDNVMVRLAARIGTAPAASYPGLLAEIRKIDGGFCKNKDTDFDQSTCAARVASLRELDAQDFDTLEARLRAARIF
ncbi:hypothetical protein [Sandarakinorhabdus sp.]|uniref:hypothetical protein n=1 Tax=Sandarakinorhabdus sp. TaxID=1916663 RepID=UPI00286D6F77|nr:hypothetical protein [Sandarakinorhabdus sp.]